MMNGSEYYRDDPAARTTSRSVHRFRLVFQVRENNARWLWNAQSLPTPSPVSEGYIRDIGLSCEWKKHCTSAPLRESVRSAWHSWICKDSSAMTNLTISACRGDPTGWDKAQEWDTTSEVLCHTIACTRTTCCSHQIFCKDIMASRPTIKGHENHIAAFGFGRERRPFVPSQRPSQYLSCRNTLK